MAAESVTIQRGADRAVSAGGGIVSRHALSFGAHYDPSRTAVGALVAHNDDVLEPGVAYGAHEHRDVEILTWVLSGAMRHRGPDGRTDVVRPGVLQHLAAGTGWHHDEECAGDVPVHLLQLWITPGLDDPPPGPPTLTHVAVPLAEGRAVVAAGGADALVPLRRGGVELVVVRVGAGERWEAVGGEAAGGEAGREVAARHVHVARGAVVWSGTELRSGDALEVAGPGAVTLTAGPEGAEVLVVSTGAPR